MDLRQEIKKRIENLKLQVADIRTRDFSPMNEKRIELREAKIEVLEDVLSME